MSISEEIKRIGEVRKLLFTEGGKTNADHIRSMTDEELAVFLCKLAYGGEAPWSEPFARKFCDNCPTVRGTYESGQEDDFTECDFVDLQKIHFIPPPSHIVRNGKRQIPVP